MKLRRLLAFLTISLFAAIATAQQAATTTAASTRATAATAATAQPARRRGRVRTPATPATGAASPAPAAAEEIEPPTAHVPDSETLLGLIQAAAVGLPAEGARAIGTMLLRGVPPRVAAAGLDALSVLGHADGSAAVIHFLRHRRASLRRHAIAAAQAIHSPELVQALAGLLGDSDEDVRVDAATALGEVGHAAEAAPLFAAFERDLANASGPEGGRLTHESARAIARIGTADDVTRLLTFLRRAAFRSMSDAMRIALGRREIPDPVKLRVVAAVGDLATHEVREFLNSIVTAAHGADSAVVRAARAAAERIAN